MSWDQLDHMLSKFNFSFNWEYRGNGELRSLLSDVFRILESGDERSFEQILVGCVHQSYPGLTLNQPQSDAGLPYEMKFVVQPTHEEFCITKVIILSEARNLELYINGGYEKSSRGVMLTMNKGRKLSLFEAEFDLSSYTNTISDATIKFLSFPCKNKMKLQAVVMKVEKCHAISSTTDQESGPVDLDSVKRFLGSVGRPLSNDAQKMLQSIERYQKSPVFKAQQLLSASQNASFHRTKEPTSEEAVRPNDEKDGKRLHGTLSPEQDEPFMNMLAEICLKRSDGDGERPPSEFNATQSSPQSRWTAYLQSRVRASQNASSSAEPRLRASRPISLEGYPGIAADHVGSERSRQRPNSVGCVDRGEVDKTFRSEKLRKEWLQEGQHSACKACGCPGCLSVYNAVTATIFAAEERIMERVDKKLAELQENIDQKFDSLVQLLSKGREMREQISRDDEVSSMS